MPRAVDGVETRRDGRSDVLTRAIESFVQAPLGLPEPVCPAVLLMQFVGQTIPTLTEPLRAADIGAPNFRRITRREAPLLALRKCLIPCGTVRPSPPRRSGVAS